MRETSIRPFACVGAVLLLVACVTTQPQADGSTKVQISLSGMAKPTHDNAQNPGSVVPTHSAGGAESVKPALTGAPDIRVTTLAGLFTKRPFDGTPKTHFPRVAVTVTDWSRNDCWTAVATIWWNKAKSEQVQPFSVCWGRSVGYAVNNAASLHLFMQQTAVEHSGNVRTAGPKPPMIAIPDRQPISEQQQLAFQGFIQQLVLDTGWQPGAPTTMWLVGYDTNAAAARQAVTKQETELPKAVDARAQQLLEQALACSSIDKSFDAAESALRQAGWRPDQGVTPVSLAHPLKIFGLRTQKVAVSRDGGEHTYRSYLSGVSLQQAVKAASLKLGKNGKNYGRVTKLGVLTVDTESGETTLTCTVDTERY